MKYMIPVMVLVVAIASTPAIAGQRSYGLQGFDRIRASNHVQVIYRQGPYSIQVEEPNSRFDELVLKVEGSTLVIGRQQHSYWGWWWGDEDYTRFTVTVTAPMIDDIDASSHAKVSGAFNAPNLKLDVSSHGQISGAFAASNIDVTASSHGDVRGSLDAAKVRLEASSHAVVDVHGRCGDLSVNASSHADFNGQALQCETARFTASSHAGVDAYASRSARGEATSHADVVVRGHPAEVVTNASSHGTVRKL